MNGTSVGKSWVVLGFDAEDAMDWPFDLTKPGSGEVVCPSKGNPSTQTSRRAGSCVLKNSLGYPSRRCLGTNKKDLSGPDGLELLKSPKNFKFARITAVTYQLSSRWNGRSRVWEWACPSESSSTMPKPKGTSCLGTGTGSRHGRQASMDANCQPHNRQYR
jgi:hypothetical protein